MTLPRPHPGLVIRYSYLWRAEHLQGRDEGVKDRPAAIVLVTKTEGDDELVTVLPITHAQPRDPNLAVEIPGIVKERLGLDSDRSWIVISEANRFIWPGPDLRPLPGQDLSTVAYGVLPPRFFDLVRRRLVEAVQHRRARVVQRE